MEDTQEQLDYARVERAIRYLDANYRAQPSLADVAGHVNLSPHHFERLFIGWAGVSPKKYLQYLTKEHAKVLLKSSATVLDATLESGLSSPGRLHDLFVTYEGVSPGELKMRGRGLTISYGLHETPFGLCLLATTERGICGLHFLENSAAADDLLPSEWPGATLVRDDEATGALISQIFRPARGETSQKLQVFLSGSRFQLSVWEALLKIPSGSVSTYKAIAETLGKAGASRAVGQAVGSNPVALLIPCHRVLRGSGEISGYRWGVERKTAMLFREYVQSRK